MKKQFRLTQAGVDELQTEHASLVAKRGDLAEAIRSARELGDLAENSEYQTARAEQERTESRISELAAILASVEIIKKPTGDSKVQLGSSVKLKSQDGKEREFQVVGTVEADPLSGKISDESPIGQALLGKKEGESVEIKTPADTTTYKVVDIS
ncbi:MAG: greA [Candidatus Saccharibacteria bacterium]|nr:greA [Candidatus Saccharibacteria bacterium]